VFLDCSRSTNSVVKRCVLHTFHNGFAASVDFFWIIASKCSRNCRTVIHPAFQLKLSHYLAPFTIGFRPALGDLVTPHIWLVKIMNKIDGKLDQEIALQLGVVRVVEPIVKISLISKPKHGVPAVLDPKGLLPFFHNNCPERNSRQNMSLFADKFCLGKSRSLRSLYLLR